MRLIIANQCCQAGKKASKMVYVSLPEGMGRNLSAGPVTLRTVF